MLGIGVMELLILLVIFGGMAAVGIAITAVVVFLLLGARRRQAG